MVVEVSLKCWLNLVGPSGVSGVKQTILWSVWGGEGVGASLQDVLSLILEHASVMGWAACCCPDDTLASKKLYPKYQFPRVKSSEDSMRMLVRMVHTTHEKTTRLFHKKLDTHHGGLG